MHESSNNAQTSQSFPWTYRLLQEIYQRICQSSKIARLLTLLTRQQVKFEWTPEHQAAFVHLKDAIVQTPILHYPNPNKTYIVYTDASDDACRA